MTSRASFDAAMDPPPVFVGGTGRSGTTILGNTIDAHRSYALIPIELRFHTDRQGLIDVLKSRMPIERFINRMKGPLFYRMSEGGPRGLHLITTKQAVSEALEEFADTFHHDRFTAARRLIQRIVQPVLERSGKRSWVEMTPWNVGRAAILVRIFPEMKLIHTVRDGRDVAASVANTWWGPDDPVDALHWWCERIRGAESAARMLDNRTLHVVHFEELVNMRRGETFQKLLDFLQIDRKGIEDFFDAEVTQQNANLGTWRARLNYEDAQLLDGLYRRMFDELVLDDVECRPVNPDWNFAA